MTGQHKCFSQRLGITNEPSTIQIESMNDALRNSLWNIILQHFGNSGDYRWENLAEFSAMHYFKVPVDSLPYDNYEQKDWIRELFFKLEWYKTYDFIEFIFKNYRHIMGCSSNKAEQGFIGNVNFILERELSGYRFVEGVLVPISSKEEVSEICEAIDRSVLYGLNGAREHIQAALRLLGQKPDPNYRNSIKEAISAVESVVKQIAGDSSQGLADALNVLDKNVGIHGALKEGFKKLYGYSSDEDGIRHAILEEANIGYDEAKFMIVSCSAFVNFLISKADKAGLISSQ